MRAAVAFLSEEQIVHIIGVAQQDQAGLPSEANQDA